MIGAGLIAAALVLAGALLAWRGWRGVRVNEHPVCRGCGFDLVGTVTPGGGAGKVCPKCGAGLGERGAVRHGQRRRRPVVVGAGCVLLVLGAAVGTLVVAVRSGGFDWNTVKPAWLLVREAQWPGFQSDLVLRELMVRRTDGTLSSETYRRLAEHGLAVQADAAAPWTALWGDLILDAQDRGDLPLDRAHAFIHNSVSVAAKMRPRVRAGAQAPYEVTLTTTRGATDPGKHPANVRVREVRLRGPNGESRTQTGYGGMGVEWIGRSVTFNSSVWFGREPLAPGEWQVEVAFEIDLVAAGQREFVHTGTLVVTEQPTVTMVDAPGCVVGVREAMAELGDPWKQHGRRGVESVRYLQVTIHPSRVDRPASFALIARWQQPDGAEKEQPLGGIVLRPNLGIGWPAEVAGDFPAEEITLVLRPDIEAAERTLDVFEVPRVEEIVVPGVKVKR